MTQKDKDREYFQTLMISLLYLQLLNKGDLQDITKLTDLWTSFYYKDLLICDVYKKVFLIGLFDLIHNETLLYQLNAFHPIKVKWLGHQFYY